MNLFRIEAQGIFETEPGNLRRRFARVVKGVDLRSTGGKSAWVRTPQLTCFGDEVKERSLSGNDIESSGYHGSLAEQSKALAQGAIPKGRGFEPHSCHFSTLRHNAHIKSFHVSQPSLGFVRFSCFENLRSRADFCFLWP